jgi:hypothetical protein
MRMVWWGAWAVAVLVLTGAPARADRQMIAPGTGQQAAVVVDAGANGICETAAHRDDFQQTPVGQSQPFADEIRCGPDRIANTTAAGDDTQVLPVGTACRNANQVVVDTGPDGVANTAAVGDDRQLLPVGQGTPNTPCILTGGKGIAATPDPVGGDDVRLIAAGAAEANAPVIRCGPNRIAETFANNVRGGDDVQLVGVGAACPSANTVVVDAGANGIAETRAQGPDLVLARVSAPVVRLTIHRHKTTASRTVKVIVENREFGTSAPPSRLYALSVDDGSCPGGTVVQVDADAHAPGIQATAAVPLHGRVKGAFVVALRLDDVTSVERQTPFRCTVDVEADAVDTVPAPDDAINQDNNRAQVLIEAVDANDH